jgi:signal transduction histidine kinase
MKLKPRKPKLFKSIYGKFTVLFLCMWWLLNSMAFGVVIHAISKRFFINIPIRNIAMNEEFERVRLINGAVFLFTAIIGTLVILIFVRSMVRPIKRLSVASMEVAKGNFDVQVDVTTEDEIGQLTSDFNLMTTELKNIDVMRKDFVSNVSHEFKTPITSIKGFAKLIRDEQLSSAELAEYSEIIVQESERLSVLSSSLLKLSELDSRIIREQGTLFSLDEQIRKAILILEPVWSKKQIEFELELPKVTLHGDEFLLQEVWLNLIQNAIKFSSEAGLISISLTQQQGQQGEQGHIEVKISDQGIGIAEQDKERIFERFFKCDPARSKDGNGLGLVIVKKIVELFNGTIAVESKLGEGATFIVKL